MKDVEKISPNIRVKRAPHKFYRIYWDKAYIHEVYGEMPEYGHDIEENDMRLISQKYAEEHEDRTELTRKIKNFKEGYWESLDRIRTRNWLMRNNKEFHEKSVQAYKQHVIK